MKLIFLALAMTMGVAMANSKDVKVTSPDGRVVVTISDNGDFI